jgi:hypothetical protein
MRSQQIYFQENNALRYEKNISAKFRANPTNAEHFSLGS